MNAQLEFPMPAQPTRRESERIYAAVMQLRRDGYHVVRVGRMHRICVGGIGRLVDDRQLKFLASISHSSLLSGVVVKGQS